MSWFSRKHEEEPVLLNEEDSQAFLQAMHAPGGRERLIEAFERAERGERHAPDEYYCGICGWQSLKAPCEHLPIRK